MINNICNFCPKKLPMHGNFYSQLRLVFAVNLISYHRVSSIPGLFSLQRMPPPLLFQAIVRVRVRAIVLRVRVRGVRLGLKC